VVTAPENSQGNKRLVAYVVPKDATTKTSSFGSETVGRNGRNKSNGSRKPARQDLLAALRKHLGGKLPDYMIPAAFVMMDSLPLTPSGKVDRKALPAPEASTFTEDRDYVSPTNDDESVLTSIWAKVLKIDKVGINDDVFELGADSLLIFQIVTRAAQMGLRMTPRQVFENRTVAGIVKAMSADRKRPGNISGPAIARASREAFRTKRSSSAG